MKHLLFAISLFAMVTASYGQGIIITNIRASGIINGTNDNINVTVNTNAESAGFDLFFQKQKMVAEQQTNPAPTAQQAIKDAINEMLVRVLAEQARAHKRKTNSVAPFFSFGPGIFELMTPQQQADQLAIINALNIKTNLPAQ